MWTLETLDDHLSALRRHWREADEEERAARAALVAQRQSIAAGIETLGCSCRADGTAAFLRQLRRQPFEHGEVCPLAIAAGVREGRIR